MILDARSGPAMGDGYFGGELREKRRFFHRRVAAADDNKLFVSKEKPVASRASRDKPWPIASSPFETEQFCRRAGRND